MQDPIRVLIAITTLLCLCSGAVLLAYLSTSGWQLFLATVTFACAFWSLVQVIIVSRTKSS